MNHSLHEKAAAGISAGAEATAIFYKKLIANGVPEDAAVKMTQTYLQDLVTKAKGISAAKSEGGGAK